MTSAANRYRPKTPAALGVAILGAGVSSRMGRPKLLLPWGKTTIIGHLVRQWRRLGARQIAVVCRADDERLANELDRLKFPERNRIINSAPERGMFSSIVCAANWNGWDPSLTVWAIALGDQPHLRTSSLRALLAFQRRHPGCICQPSYEDRGRHPVLLPRCSWEKLAKSRAKMLKQFLRQSTIQVLRCDIDDPGLIIDLDTPGDYAQVLSSAKIIE